MSTQRENKGFNILTATIGDEITLSGKDVTKVQYIRTLETKPKAGSVDKSTGKPVVPQPYAQMRYGNVSFTINSAADIAIVSKPDWHANVDTITMIVSEITSIEVGQDGNPTGNEIKTQGLSFGSILTLDSANKFEMRAVVLEGMKRAEMIKSGLALDIKSERLLDAEVQRILNAPVAAPAVVATT